MCADRVRQKEACGYAREQPPLCEECAMRERRAAVHSDRRVLLVCKNYAGKFCWKHCQKVVRAVAVHSLKAAERRLRRAV
jgi:hypothetical protein